MTTPARAKPARPRPSDLKDAWKARTDRGPHKAVLPSGIEVTFIVPNSNELIRADRLPDRLAQMAIMAASYPDGTQGYLGDLAVSAIHDEDAAVKLKAALKDGLELHDWLISHMLVAPKLTAEEVGSGDFPQPDLEMLIEFAERRRDTDAAGTKLPIVVLETLATFRDGAAGGTDAAAGANGAPAADEPAVGADGS